jgi:hypothetical protein
VAGQVDHEDELEVGARQRHRGLLPPARARPPPEKTAALDAPGFAEDGARSTAADAAGDRHNAVRAWGTQPLTEADVEMLGQRWRG